jgi:hypothetical protein
LSTWQMPNVDLFSKSLCPIGSNSISSFSIKSFWKLYRLPRNHQPFSN